MEKLKIAVIGGGIGGLTAGWLLGRKHEVQLFEMSSRLGGNAFNYTTHDGEVLDIAVAAFGKAGYPNFYSVLEELGIDTALCTDSYMSFMDLDSGEGFYFTPSWRALKKQDFSVLRPFKLIAILRLFVGLERMRWLHKMKRTKGKSLGEVLEKIPEIRGDARIVFLSALCLLSSMSADEILDSPAGFFIEKLTVHHDVLSPKAIWSVRCVKEGTRHYVHALARNLGDCIRLNAAVSRVRRSESGVAVVLKDGTESTFDKVVFACNADQALRLIENPTEDEKKLLGAWKYKEGRVVLHRDHSSFPPRDLTQAYTFLFTERGGRFAASVNGALWHEPKATRQCDYIATQHPNFPIRKDLIEFDTILRTPIFDFKSWPTVKELPKLNGVKNSYFCGSHFGFGLHEDAITSAIAVAEMLGVRREG